MDINDILDVEIKRELQMREALNELQLDELSKREIRERTYALYKSIQQNLELENV